MKDPSLTDVYQKLRSAVCPEDIFGEIIERGEPGKKKIKKVYRNLSKIAHPDLYSNDNEKMIMAKEAFQLLTDLNSEAEKRLENGTYGQRITKEDDENSVGSFKIKTAKNDYVIQSTLASGDLSVAYRGKIKGINGLEAQVLIKIINDMEDNDLAFNEIKVLKIFETLPSEQNKHLPHLLDYFKTTDNQYGIILRYFDSSYDLYSVREKYPLGLDPRHVVWILARTLSALGHAHHQNIVHGNLEPAHILIRPKDHSVCVVDWSYAAVNPMIAGDSFKVYNEPYSPPEVIEKKSPLPSSDIYSLGKTMIYLLGGDPKTNYIPNGCPLPFKKFLQSMVFESALQRPRDAWDLYVYLNELRTNVWGPSRFLELSM